MHPPLGVHRKYSQLYVIDSSEAIDIRLQMDANRHCLRDVMEYIDKFFTAK